VRAGNVGDAQPCTRHEKRKKGAKYKKCIKIENQTGCQRQQLDKTGKLTQKKKDSSSLGGNGCTAMAAHSAANSGSPHPTIADMSARPHCRHQMLRRLFGARWWLRRHGRQHRSHQQLLPPDRC